MRRLSLVLVVEELTVEIAKAIRQGIVLIIDKAYQGDACRTKAKNLECVKWFCRRAIISSLGGRVRICINSVIF